MGALVCKNISKRYKDTKVLTDIDLTIEKGKIYGLIGRNGVGKTTLLSIMSAQNPPTKGEVTLDGEPVWENAAALRRICFSRELNAMNGNMPNTVKVKEYLRMASFYYENWDKEMADRLVKKFGLDIKKQMIKLSKGMLSMVTIIVALASKAEYTFLDEPVAGLDVVARDDFYRLLIDEYAESGRTFIISTHIIDEASDVFEEVVVLKSGKILLKENTETLLSRAVHISGSKEEVDRISEGHTCYESGSTGRSKGVTVLLDEGQSLESGTNVNVQKMTLQQLFVALCGGERDLNA
ncbi:MAG: ABC transporter ATP-binding protein [Lachnospiraceae bacterium]|nr:ABC transporter ATP-binding protein [Lachnospiraceae bacterium]